MDGLLRIARNWQVAADVEKNMETTSSSVDARKTSNYKKGTSTEWEEKAKSKDEQVKETCGYCGWSKHPKADCPAKD